MDPTVGSNTDDFIYKIIGSLGIGQMQQLDVAKWQAQQRNLQV